ncbi:uncharacterized protein BCR38DRAFT_444583 [Pseudomassariella vexata]|uniref:Major facilitator superfamily domain-containing protein n=1 Tax=Pseudomassariella vexata TaxID=1141098 RepID=A0A1Y2DJN4_9PEZI|nr:uncharacterized protein BCR38DRAFT_444583 [Pseudomassariella vexata]ORY59463.1 hypothetical protein BCR38DRAFT_444583 [Pseudomassariella vexata]
MVLFYLTWPKAEYLPDLERRTWRELDYLGSALLVVSSVLVVFAFQNAGGASTDVWKQARFLAPLIAGVLGWVGLIVWEIWADRRWGDRIAAGFPMRLMRNHVYGATVVNTIFLGFPFIMLVYAFPLRVQIVNGKGALLAGVMLLPMLGASATGSVVAGVINGKKDRVFETLAASSCFVTLGCGLLSTLSSSINVEAKGLGFLVFVGFGFGMSAAGCTMVANLKASIRDHAPSQGIIAQVRILGGSIGIAASAAILGVTLRTQLRGIVNPDQLASLESHPDDFSQIQLDSIRKAYSDAFSEDMRVCAVVAGVAIVLSLGTWSRNRPSVQEILSGHVREEKERRKIVKSPT